MRGKFPGASKFRDRHGKWRWRARAKGKPPVMLRGEYGSAEFVAAWEAWANGRPLEIGLDRSLPGSISSLIAGYYTAPEFQDELAPTTRKAYRATLERFRAKNGKWPIRDLTPLAITAYRDKLKPDPSNMMLRCLRHLCKYAVTRKLFSSDPTAGLRKVKIKTDGIYTWSAGDVAKFEARHAPGSRARLALALLLYTAQRKSDVVTFGRQHETDGGTGLRLRQRKTGEWLELPILPELRAAIDAAPSGSLTYLETEQGRPFTAAGFGNWFRDRCNEAELPHCSAHGLRKAAATRLADAGKTAHEIMSITGHKSLSEVERYTKAANQKRLARAAAGALTGPKPERDIGKPLTRFAKNRAKALKDKAPD